MTFGLVAEKSSSTVSSWASSRPQMPTSQPSCASLRAMAWPIPRVPR